MVVRRQGAHRRRRRLPGRPVAAPPPPDRRRTPAAIYRALRRREPVAVHVLPRHSTASSSSAPRPRRTSRSSRRHLRAAPDRRHPPARRDAGRDDALAAELPADEKERAEHIMLVDLARNDLGRVCDPGTVRVDALHRGRALLARHAPRRPTSTAACRRRDALALLRGTSRPAPSRGAEGARDADHLRARAAAAAPMPAPSATSASAATWTPASRCGRSCWATDRYSRPAAVV